MRYSKVFGRTTHNLPSGSLEKGQAYLIQGGLLHSSKERIPILLPIGRRAWNNILRLIRKHLQGIDVQEVGFPLPLDQGSTEDQNIKQVDDQVLFSFLIELLEHHISSYRDLPVKLGYSRVLATNKSCLLNREGNYTYTILSVDKDNQEQKQTSSQFKEALSQIFSSLGLQVRESASTSNNENELGFSLLGETSSGTGEYFRCNQCDYIAPYKLAKSSFPTYPQDEEQKPLKRIYGPDLTSVEDLADFAGISVPTITKTLIFETEETRRLIVVMIRGEYEVSEEKLKHIVGEDLYLAPAITIKEEIGAEVGYSGVVDLPDKLKLIADLTTEGRVNFECGANEKDYHLLNVNFGRDVPEPEEFYDVRQVKEGETCSKCGKGDLQLVKAANLATFSPISRDGINQEISYMGEDGNRHPFILGSCKIFTSTIFALALENSWDDQGIIWPPLISPFQVHLVSLGRQREILKKAEEVYNKLRKAGINVLWDDRNKKPGVKFNDADLLGIPIRLVVGKKSCEKERIEWKEREADEAILIPEGELIDKIKEFYDTDFKNQSDI